MTIFNNNKSYRYLPFQLLNFSDNSSFRNGEMPKQYLLHCSSGQSMPGCIDDIIQSCHNIKIAITIEIASITSSVITWCLFHIFLKKGLIIVIERTHERWWHRQFYTYFTYINHIVPRVLTATIQFLWFRIYTLKPGHGLVALPALYAKVCRFLQLHDIIQPIYVCQQLSLINTFNLLRIHSQVGISHRQPAIETALSVLISYLSTHSPKLSYFLIARKPVGLVYSPLTLYFYMIAHKAPGLGSVGLPSQSRVAAPLNKGPQMVKLCPTTHPISLAAKQVSP